MDIKIMVQMCFMEVCIFCIKLIANKVVNRVSGTTFGDGVLDSYFLINELSASHDLK